ncbi:MAG: hypothetical protein ABR969_06565 [Sedimentisphaerales bacterium]
MKKTEIRNSIRRRQGCGGQELEIFMWIPTFVGMTLLILNSICLAKSNWIEKQGNLPQKQNIPQKTKSKIIPVRDGFILDGVDGKITEVNEQWYFTVFEPLMDGKGVLNPQTPVEILPSSTLEKLSSVVSAEKNSYRIWGKFTKFENKNYVYLSYFLPVAPAEEPAQQLDEDSNDVNETKIIPEDALLLLKPKRIISLAELKKPIETGADGVIIDRTGFLEKTKDGFYFGFDEMGRNINLLHLPLLQCEELERIAKEQKDTVMPLRYNISAIVTRYKGRNYLLLQRAARAYNYGNLVK